ncbi:hypothetical protein [Micromonospora mirobrigensis]|uniref:Uncharacterized protein n=1 Tax=Micromonospora mirobrigensis TaxID=262898 RepID=A0A1C4XDU1_9ACTN|nr:hypothetical protein [Micromonospora mirobrigensis]SCF06688.1 hypothetical protein GA0070564_10323 [Micromonospora mirobrigensis]
MPTTSKGLTYPTSTGHARIWEHIQTLAQDVDRVITKPAIGKASNTVSQSSITTEAVSLTVSSMVFKAGWAYRAYIRTAVYGTVGAQVAFRLRKTNATGTDLGEFGRVTCDGTVVGSSAMVNGSIVLVRSAGTDLTTDVVLTVSASTGTVNCWAGTSSPRYLIIEPIGTAAEYAGLGVDVN